MQHIQDNEFDRLFKDKFEEAEVTPPANVWDEIETQLSVKPKRAFPLYRVAAAFAAVAISLALLLSKQEKEHIRLVATTTPVPVAPALPELPAAPISKHKAIVLKQAAKARPLKKDLESMQPLAINPHPYTYKLSVKQDKLGLPVSASSAIDTLILAALDKQAEAADQVVEEKEIRPANKGIRNMGDLINYVVDKVDKNDEKIIQFKTEDDNSSLVALNIGIIRFNTKKHK